MSVGCAYMEHIDVNIFNTWMQEHGCDESMFDEDGRIIMKNKKDYRSTSVISNIFEEHWEMYYSKYKNTIDKMRPNANIEVHKLIDCANHNLGATIYACPRCDEIYFCNHTCKGKLCSSCGIKAQMKITENILQTCIKVPHRHMTFTIPKSLTSWFFDDLKSTELLFDAVSDTLYSVVNGKAQKKVRKYLLKWKPAFFAFLHTFGRPLNFNPHIHVIIAEEVMDKLCNIKKFNYFDYNALSKRFMTILLNKMEKYFGKQNFKDTKNEMFSKYKNGFYVNNRLEDDGKKFKTIETLIKYVTRYCKRPIIAESRIINYDGENVTYSYIAHKDNKYHEVTISVYKFITLLIAHLLPFDFKSIRSYGFYNKPSKISDDIARVISREKCKLRKGLLNWKNSILISFKRIPILCEKCNTLMEPIFEVS